MISFFLLILLELNARLIDAISVISILIDILKYKTNLFYVISV